MRCRQAKGAAQLTECIVRDQATATEALGARRALTVRRAT
jgi:hypothetical protein